MRGVSVLMPIAYDWPMALNAIQACWPVADEIVLGLDKDRISWSHKPFVFDMDAFMDGIRNTGAKCSIKLVNKNFHEYELPIKNDTYERRCLSIAARPNTWLVSIDSDEQLLNPLELREWLLGPEGRRIEQAPELDGAFAYVEVVYKIVPEGLLLISPKERIHLATHHREAFAYARQVRVDWKHYIHSPALVRHWAYGRTAEAIREKLRHWGHSNQMAHKVEDFMAQWERASFANCHEYKNFHPICPTGWEGLLAIPRNVK